MNDKLVSVFVERLHQSNGGVRIVVGQDAVQQLQLGGIVQVLVGFISGRLIGAILNVTNENVVGQIVPIGIDGFRCTYFSWDSRQRAGVVHWRWH